MKKIMIIILTIVVILSIFAFLTWLTPKQGRNWDNVSVTTYIVGDDGKVEVKSREGNQIEINFVITKWGVQYGYVKVVGKLTNAGTVDASHIKIKMRISDSNGVLLEMGGENWRYSCISLGV